MIWKNPFLIRQAEKIDTVDNFLQLFSAEALSFIDEQSFNIIQFVRSSPGAGKTTVFKAMQPNVLIALSDEIEYKKEFYEIAIKNKMIEDGEVKLLSCMISCAKNYDLIDELFKNGRRQQVLFALLNVRIVVLMLKSIMTVKNMQDLNLLESITFVEYPEECGLISEKVSNGYNLYNWAQSEERRICQYLDALSDKPTNFSLSYTTLFFAKLFEPHNVLYNNRPFLFHSLIIFDDVQKLTKHQRELLTTTFFTMRPNMGIWLGERLEALSKSEIITSDATKGREYDAIYLEEYWKSKGKSNYRKTLENIADRRTKLFSDDISGFENCLDNRIDYKKYHNNLNDIILTVKSKLEEDIDFGRKYLKLLDYINSQHNDIYEKALAITVIDINYRRDVSNGQISFLSDDYSLEKYEEFYKKNVSVAMYYLCVRAKVPYYYGLDVIKDISSYNIEQFLAFAGSIYEQYVARSILKSKLKSNMRVKPDDQERYIRQVAVQRFDEILSRFEHGENIQNLLNNLSDRSQKTRDRGTNPYAGGAATGVAISKSSLDSLNIQRYSKLAHVLSDCISSNYFIKKNIEHSNQEWIVLYYNRWLCVYYGLPLSYGGWFRATIDELNTFLLPQNKMRNWKELPIDTPFNEVLL